LRGAGAGDQETYPRKAAKKTGALRRGAAFVVTRGDELLVRTRVENGLLGGMTEVPGSNWIASQDDKAALKQAPVLKGMARWHRKAGIVTTSSRIFHLNSWFTERMFPRIRVHLPECAGADCDIEGRSFANVMRKVIAHGWIFRAVERPSMLTAQSLLTPCCQQAWARDGLDGGSHDQHRARRVHAPPSSRLLGWHLLDAPASDGWVRIGFDGKPEFCNPAGFIQAASFQPCSTTPWARPCS